MKKRFLTKSDIVGYLFVLPTLLAIIAFSFYPIIQAFVISFYNHNGVKGVFNGGVNYINVLKDPYFTKAMTNTLYMGLLGMAIGLPFSLILATFINYCSKGKSFFKSVFFLPNVTSVVASALIFTFLYYPDSTGPMNQFLGLFGIPAQRWFSSPDQAKISIVLMSIWHGAGYNAIIWLAGLQSIPEELFEAAAIDGASKVKQWVHITIPSIMPIIGFMVIMGTIGMFKRFGDTFVIGGPDGNPGSALYTLMLYVYRNTFMMYSFGRASAASFIIFLIIMLFTLMNFKLLSKTEK